MVTVTSRPRLRFWGVRGSVPAPGPGTARHGGNTPCVSLEAEGEPLIILDAGTGIRMLGAELAARGAPYDAVLLLTHTHWDHIQGLPFLVGLYEAGNRITIRGPRPLEGTLRGVLEGLATPAVFPIPVGTWAAVREIVDLDGGGFSVGNWEVASCVLSHPGPTMGFRLTRPGCRGIAYVTDNELSPGLHGMRAGWRQGLVDFIRGVDVLIHDTANSEEQVVSRRGWGHSSASQALALAAEGGCGRLLLFHHDPDRDDDAVDAVLAETRRRAAADAPGLAVDAAGEGMILTLELDG